MVDLAGGEGGKGQTGPGFYCEVCRKLLKDNLAYLDHVNGRVHLMRIGQSTQQDRASLEDVKKMLDELRRTKLGNGGEGGGKGATYDFDERIKKIAEQEEKEREEKRQKRRQQKLLKKGGKQGTGAAADADGKVQEEEAGGGQSNAEEAMMAAMGFGGFGTTKRR